MHEPSLKRPPIIRGSKSEPPNWEIPFTIPDPTVPDIRRPDGDEPHYHRGQDGLFYRCYHHCRNSLTSVSFWIGMTIGFPLEHTLWEKVPGFAYITHLLGL